MARTEPDSDQSEALPPISSVRVTLGPRLGMPARVWVTGLWAIAAIAFLVWLLLFPGIREPGSVVRFVSLPPGSAVYLGDRYLTDTPGEAFVPRGEHTFTIRGLSASATDVSAEVGGRIFASRVVPRRQQISVMLPEPSFAAGIPEFQLLSARPEPVAEDPVPRLLSDMAPGVPLDAATILRLAAHADSDAARADLLGAVLRSGSGPGSASPLALLYRLQVLDGALSFAPDLAVTQLTAAGLAPADQPLAGAAGDQEPGLVGSPQPVGARRVGGLRLVRFSEGAVPARPEDPRGLGSPQSDEAAQRAPLRVVPAFLLQDREMTLSAVIAVLGEAEARRVAGAFASDDPDAPLSGLTAREAGAILAEMSAEIPGSLRLPTDSELAAAQLAVARGDIAGRNDVFDSPAARPLPGSAGEGLHDIEGNLWELSATEFAPLMDAAPPADLDDGSAFVSVRGGSFISRRSLTGTATRGALPAGLPSPYAGFRAVWEPGD